MGLRTFIRNCFRPHGTSPERSFGTADGGVRLPGFQVEIRLGPRDARVKIGERTVLGCRIIMERETGMVVIGDQTYIGSGTGLISAEHITIGSNVLIAWGCTIVDHDSHALDWAERRGDIAQWRRALVGGGGLAGAAASKNWNTVPMAPVQIKDKAWLGFNVIVLKGVTIGEGSVIGAGSVVTTDVPDWTVAAGNPARVIRELPRPKT